MKAVLEIQWHQYIVSEWDTLLVDQFKRQKEWDSLDLDTVLLTFDDEWNNISLGTHYVEWASVTVKLQKYQKWAKVKVFKFQGKKRYHKTYGFRPSQTLLSIEKINV